MRNILCVLGWLWAAPACAALAAGTPASLPPKTLSPQTMALASADLDGDGDTDLIRALEFGTNDVLLNDGTGRFAAELLPGRSGDHEDIATADFDGDGDIDIVVMGEDDHIAHYYENLGAGAFRRHADRFPPPLIANSVLAGDLDEDGDADLVVVARGPDALWRNDGTGRFSEMTDALPGIKDTSQDAALGDLDGDHDPDLVFAGEDGNRLYLNAGDGRFTEAPLPRRPSQEETRDVALADVDGDGDLDLYFANVRFFVERADRQDRLLLNEGDGRFTEATGRVPVLDLSTSAAAFVDWDGDADPDLVLGFTTALEPGVPGPAPRLFLNDGSGDFLTPGPALPDSIRPQAFDIAAEDLDGDGRPDLVFASRGTGDSVLFNR